MRSIPAWLGQAMDGRPRAGPGSRAGRRAGHGWRGCARTCLGVQACVLAAGIARAQSTWEQAGPPERAPGRDAACAGELAAVSRPAAAGPLFAVDARPAGAAAYPTACVAVGGGLSVQLAVARQLHIHEGRVDRPWSLSSTRRDLFGRRLAASLGMSPPVEATALGHAQGLLDGLVLAQRAGEQGAWSLAGGRTRDATGASHPVLLAQYRYEWLPGQTLDVFGMARDGPHSVGAGLTQDFGRLGVGSVSVAAAQEPERAGAWAMRLSARHDLQSGPAWLQWRAVSSPGAWGGEWGSVLAAGASAPLRRGDIAGSLSWHVGASEAGADHVSAVSLGYRLPLATSWRMGLYATRSWLDGRAPSTHLALTLAYPAGPQARGGGDFADAPARQSRGLLGAFGSALGRQAFQRLTTATSQSRHLLAQASSRLPAQDGWTQAAAQDSERAAHAGSLARTLALAHATPRPDGGNPAGEPPRWLAAMHLARSGAVPASHRAAAVGGAVGLTPADQDSATRDAAGHAPSQARPNPAE